MDDTVVGAAMGTLTKVRVAHIGAISRSNDTWLGFVTIRDVAKGMHVRIDGWILRVLVSAY